jgi:two-component system response regulator HydG
MAELMNPGRILVVDDDRESCKMLDEALTLRGFSVTWRTGAAEALGAIESCGPFDVVLTDLRMGESNGLELCVAIAGYDPTLPVIVITAFGSIETAVDAMRTGAFDFITKPFDLEMVALSLQRAVRHHQLRAELVALRGAVVDGFEGMVGTSQAMQKVFETLSRVALSDSTVLITGESGTGKELAARALHARSTRAQRPFLAINCAAIPEALLESELFGHTKGAFTDARSDRPGLFTKANGGTLFLDEVGEMPPSMQVKLLRALQERAVRPVGSEREVPFEARIVAATNRDLEAEVAAGRFRGDLFFRIHVIELMLPPLRARGSDVLLLASTLVAVQASRAGRAPMRLSHEAAERLLAYEWPGNVRELENCMERAVALASKDEISAEDLPERVRRGSGNQVLIRADAPDELVSLEEMERRYILRVMRAVEGNKKLAAQILGLDRSTLYRKLERYSSEG